MNAGQSSFQPGDSVWMVGLVKRIRGRILERRGPFGGNGRQLYVVQPDDETWQPRTVNEDELEYISEDQPLTPQEIVDYLTSGGGLLRILSLNSPEPIWLIRGSDDNVTFCFSEGEVGGQPAPAFALTNDSKKIFEPKREEVQKYLVELGLSVDQAQWVIKQVGIGM
jgi:hypothetical protein